MLVPRLLRSKKNLLESVNAFAAWYPLCRLQCSLRETFTAAGHVTQCDGIGRGIETNLVSAGMFARAAGTRVDVASVSTLLHGIDKVKKSAGWRVLLCVMVDLPRPGSILGFIAQEFGGGGGKPAEYSYTDREVRAPDQTGPRFVHAVGDVLQVRKPAGSAGYSRDL